MRWIPLAAAAMLACIAAGPATQSTTAPADAALWARLASIDDRAGQVKSLSAKFQQQKFTAILKKPLVSSGRIRVHGASMRWDTLTPEPSVMLIDQHEARMFYPGQKTLEIYPLDQRLGELAASPLPRLRVLKSRFSFEQIPSDELQKSADPKQYLALRLIPTDAAIGEHVKQVRVLLDVQAAYIVKAEVTDSDGDRTLLSFTDVQLNGDVGDLSLATPPGTTVTRPLEGLDGQSPPQGPRR